MRHTTSLPQNVLPFARVVDDEEQDEQDEQVVDVLARPYKIPKAFPLNPYPRFERARSRLCEALAPRSQSLERHAPGPALQKLSLFWPRLVVASLLKKVQVTLRLLGII